MSEPEKSEVKDEPGAQERFDAAIKNALAMPPKPHDGAAKRPRKKPKPKTD